jgi:hypothetical protein
MRALNPIDVRPSDEDATRLLLHARNTPIRQRALRLREPRCCDAPVTR